MSIFIAELAFSGQTENLLIAKTSILAASVLAGICGCASAKSPYNDPVSSLMVGIGGSLKRGIDITHGANRSVFSSKQI